MTAVLIFSGQASVYCQKHSDPFVKLPDTKNKELNNSKKREQTHFPLTIETTVADRRERGSAPCRGAELKEGL